MENNEQTTRMGERPHGANSLLSVGETKCDRCGKIIRHLERYYYSILECPICGARFSAVVERESHSSQQHPPEPSRGTRYCLECAAKIEYEKEPITT